MAQIEENNRNKTKRYSAKKSIRVDLTPMVDLGFLLITFFILTTTLSDPTIAKLVLPKDNVATPVRESAVLTLRIIRNDSVEYSEGSVQKNAIKKYCSFKNLRTIIQQKQKEVASVLGDRKEIIIFIYAENESTYKNFIDALDEIQINDVRHYYVMN